MRDHKGPVIFDNNTFNNIISYSGVISVEQNEGIFWAESNNFEKNVALLGSNVIDLQLGSALVEDSDSVK